MTGSRKFSSLFKGRIRGVGKKEFYSAWRPEEIVTDGTKCRIREEFLPFAGSSVPPAEINRHEVSAATETIRYLFRV